MVQMEEVNITARKRYESVNEMATLSARTFSVDETDRYAGSRGDPARMASNYAGVQGTDDSSNDIVVRGNSPMGVVGLNYLQPLGKNAYLKITLSSSVEEQSNSVQRFTHHIENNAFVLDTIFDKLNYSFILEYMGNTLL